MIVSKQGNTPYPPGRGPSWLKVKALGREELIIVGFTDRKGCGVGFGGLLVSYYNPGGLLTFAGKIGKDLSDKLLRCLYVQLEELAQDTRTVNLLQGISGTARIACARDRA